MYIVIITIVQIIIFITCLNTQYKGWMPGMDNIGIYRKVKVCNKMVVINNILYYVGIRRISIFYHSFFNLVIRGRCQKHHNNMPVASKDLIVGAATTVRHKSKHNYYNIIIKLNASTTGLNRIQHNKL